MSKRSYPVWDYPSNTKTNPIPPTKSSQGRAPSNPTVAVPQGQTSQTTARAGSSVSHRGENARQNYTSPTRGRPTSNGAQQNSGKGNQTTGTAGTTGRTGTISPAKPTGATGASKPTGTAKSTGTTGKPPYRSSYASDADIADVNEIMGVSSYTGEAQDVADDFLRQNGVSSTTEYQEKFFAELEAKRKAQEERARQYRELYGSAEDEAEILGLMSRCTALRTGRMSITPKHRESMEMSRTVCVLRENLRSAWAAEFRLWRQNIFQSSDHSFPMQCCTGSHPAQPLTVP